MQRVMSSVNMKVPNVHFRYHRLLMQPVMCSVNSVNMKVPKKIEYRSRYRSGYHKRLKKPSTYRSCHINIGHQCFGWKVADEPLKVPNVHVRYHAAQNFMQHAHSKVRRDSPCLLHASGSLHVTCGSKPYWRAWLNAHQPNNKVKKPRCSSNVMFIASNWQRRSECESGGSLPLQAKD